MKTKIKLQSLLTSLYEYESLFALKTELLQIEELSQSPYIDDLVKAMKMEGEDIVYLSLAEKLSCHQQEDETLESLFVNYIASLKAVIKNHDVNAVNKQKELCSKGKKWLNKSYKEFLQEESGFAPPPEWNPLFT